MKKVGIIGGSGYTGGELIRLILQHPALEIDFVYSTTRAGKPVSSAHPDVLGRTDLLFTGTVKPEVDVLYLCLGHGKSRDFLNNHSFSETTLIVDLGNDFRLEDSCEFQGKSFVYGLPELQKEQIEKATASPILAALQQLFNWHYCLWQKTKNTPKPFILTQPQEVLEQV